MGRTKKIYKLLPLFWKYAVGLDDFCPNIEKNSSVVDICCELWCLTDAELLSSMKGKSFLSMTERRLLMFLSNVRRETKVLWSVGSSRALATELDFSGGVSTKSHVSTTLIIILDLNNIRFYVLLCSFMYINSN